MKKTLLPFLALLFTGLFVANVSSAQMGWKWGITTSNVANAPADVVGPTVTDRFGNVYVACVQDGSDSMTFGGQKVYDPKETQQCVVAKADSAGNFIWAIGVQTKGTSRPFSIATDLNGNLFIYGLYVSDTCTIGSVMLTTSYSSSFLAKISPSGTVIWAVNVTESDGFGGIAVDDSGYAYVHGAFSGTITIGTTTLVNMDKVHYTADIYLAKYDTMGNNLWAISYGGPSPETPSPYAFLCAPMYVSPTGNIFVSGQSKSDTMQIGTAMLTGDPADPTNGTKISYFAKIDSKGNTVWAEKIDRHIVINSITCDTSGYIYVTGGIDSNAIFGSSSLSWVAKLDVFTGKFDPAGSPMWAKSTGGTDNEQGYSIAADRCGKLWSCGQTGAHETINLDGHILTPVSGLDDPLYVVEYDTAGTYITSLLLSSGGDDVCGLAIDNRGNFFIGGDYEATAMSFGTSTLPYVIGGEYYFIARYEYDTSGCYIHDEKGGGGGTLSNTIVTRAVGSLILYPNPASNELTIASPDKINRISISNLMGKVVFSREYNSDKVDVNIAYLPAGMYLVKVNDAEVRKFVKE